VRIAYFTNEYSQQRQREKPVYIYPVLMAMEAEYYRQKGHQVFWNGYKGQVDRIILTPEGLPFLKLPAPDRLWTKAFDPKYQKYGNYKYHPATHMQVADGCWHGKCSFCVENKKEYCVRSIDDVMKEIADCRRLGFKEIFDDSGTFPIGNWLDQFCRTIIDQDWKIKLGCNMRITKDINFSLMKDAGFRMILFGVESINQKTLDRLNKGVKADDIETVIRDAARSGLDAHLSFMHGYGWESYNEECNTLGFVHKMLKKGYAKTAQVSLYQEEGQDSVDRGIGGRLYHVCRFPEFWFNKIKDFKEWEDFLYMIKGIRSGLANSRKNLHNSRR